MTALLLILTCILPGDFNSTAPTTLQIQSEPPHPVIYTTDYLIQLSRRNDTRKPNQNQQNNQRTCRLK
jgi:hypothetical protein